MEGMKDPDRAVVIRIIDANANRCAEGLRVVEEVARFSTRDAVLTEGLKEIRHEVRRAAQRLAGDALEHRDSDGDVGRGSATASELARSSLASVTRANFARAEEALRVLEEFGKLIDADSARTFKSLRFALYSMERSFFGGSRVAIRMPRPPFLYAILDRSVVAHGDVPSVAAALVAGGADMLQYRAKDVGAGEKRRDLVALLGAVRGTAIPVVVNDDVELAHETGAHGAHVGTDDMPPEEARAMLGAGRIVGVSVSTLDEFSRAPLDALDYVGVGAIYPSATKHAAKVVGIELLRAVRSRTAKPLVAIGGIGPSNAAEVLDAGADGIAAISALLAGDVRKNCFTLKEIIGTRLQRRKG